MERGRRVQWRQSCVWGSMTASLSEESAALTHLQKKKTNTCTHMWLKKKKTSKVNIFKSAASVAHTRTACSLSSAADYFFLRRITVESKNEREREEKWWAGAPPMKNSSRAQLVQVLPPWLQTLVCPRRRDQLTKRSSVYQREETETKAEWLVLIWLAGDRGAVWGQSGPRCKQLSSSRKTSPRVASPWRTCCYRSASLPVVTASQNTPQQELKSSICCTIVYFERN